MTELIYFFLLFNIFIKNHNIYILQIILEKGIILLLLFIKNLMKPLLNTVKIVLILTYLIVEDVKKITTFVSILFHILVCTST